MSSSVRIPAPVRERRSHSERTAETKARIMAAVVESIDEVGFHKTTGAEISRRAGVSWGAVQHHYRDKDGILVAVLESSFDLFAERLGSPPETDASLEERVALFHRGAILEVQLGTVGRVVGLTHPTLLIQELELTLMAGHHPVVLRLALYDIEVAGPDRTGYLGRDLRLLHDTCGNTTDVEGTQGQLSPRLTN